MSREFDYSQYLTCLIRLLRRKKIHPCKCGSLCPQSESPSVINGSPSKGMPPHPTMSPTVWSCDQVDSSTEWMECDRMTVYPTSVMRKRPRFTHSLAHACIDAYIKTALYINTQAIFNKENEFKLR